MNNIHQTKISYLINIPTIEDEGYLSFMEKDNQVPFNIQRVYYIYDVKNDAVRGKHAHKKTKQILFCLKGRVKIILDNGVEHETITLDSPYTGIYLDKMMWHEMLSFTKDTVLLVLASEKYNENDYIRNYAAFVNHSRGFLQNLILSIPKLSFRRKLSFGFKMRL